MSIKKYNDKDKLAQEMQDFTEQMLSKNTMLKKKIISLIATLVAAVSTYFLCQCTATIEHDGYKANITIDKKCVK